MKIGVLSTTEAEYMALSEVVKELKFIVQFLQTMNVEVALPTTVYVDNVGAIWQHKAYRHQNLFCERIPGGWKDNHQVCEVRR